MRYVYVLQHSHESQDDDNEDVKFIGVYETRTDAEAAVARLSALPGFRDFPGGFHIDEYEIGKDHWTDGFISWRQALEDETRSSEDKP